jgi:hypothetical protein
MDKFKMFTHDPKAFPASALSSYIQELQSRHQRIVMILDPGVKAEKGDPAYETGLKEGVFMGYDKVIDETDSQEGEEKEKGVFIGTVWPGKTVFPGRLIFVCLFFLEVFWSKFGLCGSVTSVYCTLVLLWDPINFISCHN